MFRDQQRWTAFAVTTDLTVLPVNLLLPEQSISTRQIDLDSILARSSSHRPQPVPSHLLHMISRTSHCWLEPINEGERSLLISFTHEEDYALAVAMLRQQQVEVSVSIYLLSLGRVRSYAVFSLPTSCRASQRHRGQCWPTRAIQKHQKQA